MKYFIQYSCLPNIYLFFIHYCSSIQGSNGGAISPGNQQNGTILDSGGAQTNGNITTETDNDTAVTNGVEVETLPTKIMDKTNQDIVRLIGQHLKTVGLEYVFSSFFCDMTEIQEYHN